MKLSGVMIGSEKPKDLGEFYIKLFGQPGWLQDDWYGFDIGGGSLMIGPHSEVKGTSSTPARLMISFETADVKGEFERIKQLGAKVIAEPYQPSKEENPEIWLATLADSDGNYLQISAPWKE